MIKFVMMLKRRKGLTLEEFEKYWLEKHGPLILKNMPGVRRYVQSHAVKLGNREPQIDGVAELWFDDLEAFKKMSDYYYSEAGKVVRDDEAYLLDKSTIKFVSQEKVLKE